jgi:hypothetical protein
MRITSNGTIGFNGTASPNNAGLNKMSMGYTDGNYGWIQTWNATPLLLNQLGNNVLIGTTTDNGFKLNVNGIVNIGTTSPYLNLLYAGVTEWKIGMLGTNDATLYFRSNGTNRLNIAESGAATFSSSVTATSFFATDVESGVYANYFGPYSGGSSSILTFLYGSSGSVTWVNGGEKMGLSSSGTLRVNSLAGSGSRTVTADASGNLSASSDSSLKKEDKSYQIEGLAEILKLQPRAYKWLNDIEIRGEKAVTEIGFFADEVNIIIPSAAPKGSDNLYGFYDRAVIAALVKGMQEQQQQIEELKAKIK